MESTAVGNCAMPVNPATPLKIGVFIELLAPHPDRSFVNQIVTILQHGANIGYFGPRVSVYTPNCKSAKIHKDVLLKSVQKEIDLGHTVGPFRHAPFVNMVCSSLGVVPKKTSGFRIILDLSRPVGQSVNDYIDKATFSLSFCSVDDAIALLKRFGKGALMAKQDIKHAFRLIPVRREDWHLLGYCIEGLYYFDVVLPFGCRSSPYLFCLFSQALHWIVAHMFGFDNLLHYMDDFFFVGKSKSAECTNIVQLFIAAADRLGIPLATEKAEGPATKLTFLGVELDSVACTIALPPNKHAAILLLLQQWAVRSLCTKTELQSLIGTLQFAAKCVPVGRLFVRRMINLLPVSGTDAIVLGADIREDIQWWLDFLPIWN
ncbi:uncharacterized protein LOC129594230 isoform X1 [Paramacrobiotus metropolitanus]|uniref:uncharacterized protein LOC129594230 isoform X1 n=1 Tax=Paramacrobiotus metropolitanus TaxID=2943436 RepID=UPI002445A7F0|nr:uncharacterized protein LOC129594230 isoform X1 [Paramacrobiotus metropolitanus]XP_055346825.1 uncharacterized protein LOC129594230 isoform X1 [Paramacrobiotus metropolitanus]